MTLTRPTLILAAASIGLLGVAIFSTLTHDNGIPRIDGEGQAFLPQFSEASPLVSQIYITGLQGTVSLQQTDTIWRVGEKGGYPADGFRVRMLVNGLSRSQKIEAKTNDVRFFDRIGLGEAAQSISFYDEEGENIASLQLGDQYMSPAGMGILTFTWDEDSQRVWTVSMLPEVTAEPSFWVEPDVLHLSRLRVKRVTITLAGSEPYEIARQVPDAADFSPLQPMGGLFNQEAINELGFALTDVFLEDVNLASTGELFHVADARYETFDGLMVDVSFFDDDGIVWATLKASFDPAAIEQEGTPAVLPDAPADGAQEVANLNALWDGYVYQLPIELVSKILKRKQDLVS